MIKFLHSSVSFFLLSSFLCCELFAMDEKENEPIRSVSKKRKIEQGVSTGKKEKLALLGQQQITSFFGKPQSVPRVDRSAQPRTVARHSTRQALPVLAIMPPPPSIPQRPQVSPFSESSAQSRTAAFRSVSQALPPRDVPTIHKPPLLSQRPQVVPPAASVQSRARAVPVPQRQDYQLEFIRGEENHITAITDLIDNAKEEIMVASWKLKYIPLPIFSSLLNAKRRGVRLRAFVNEVKNEVAENCLEDVSDEESEEDIFPSIFCTKTHAKFILADKTKGIFGSFNAFDSHEDDEESNSSLRIEGTIQQMWPFHIRLYHAYTAIDANNSLGFCSTIAISAHKKEVYPGTMNRTLQGGSKLWFLTNLKEHEEFFRLAPVGHHGMVHIYSPFIHKDNASSRLYELNNRLFAGTQLCLHTLPTNRATLESIMKTSASLRARTTIKVDDFHDKLMIIGQETLCVGSFNWLSFTRDPNSSYNNVEVSIVLQGPVARSLITHHFKND